MQVSRHLLVGGDYADRVVLLGGTNWWCVIYNEIPTAGRLSCSGARIGFEGTGEARMSAPGIGKESNLSLPDFSSVSRLPKPLKALVYLIMLAVLTAVGVSALFATVVIIGELTGSFDITVFMGR